MVLTNKGRHHLLPVYKQMHDKRDTAESSYVYLRNISGTNMVLWLHAVQYIAVILVAPRRLTVTVHVQYKVTELDNCYITIRCVVLL